MKVITLAFISLFLSFTKSGPDLSEEIAGAIRTGNAATISKYFSSSVDLKILEQENIYSKAQAELIIKEFFVKHVPKAFNIAHKSALKNDSQFAIGTLETGTGKFRVNFVMKSASASAGGTTITQFRIEPENE
jgi:hypothetical protein